MPERVLVSILSLAYIGALESCSVSETIFIKKLIHRIVDQIYKSTQIKVVSYIENLLFFKRYKCPNDYGRVLP